MYPGHAEEVCNHTEAWRKGGLGQGHPPLPAIGQSGKFAIGLGLVGHCQRQRKALKVLLPLARTVGRQHRRIPDTQGHMHHLVLATWWDHVLATWWAHPGLLGP